MIKVSEVIVVEGRYDKNALAQVVDAVILETSGFGVFSDHEKLNLIRKMADTRGVIILTDSDGAGFLIRNFLKGSIEGKIAHAYIPDISGVEKRKRSPSKEGKLGVEAMRPQVLIEALRRAGATFCQPQTDRITKADLYVAGLSGGQDSTRRRQELQKKLDLPEKLSPNALIDVLNALMSRDEFLDTIADGNDLPE